VARRTLALRDIARSKPFRATLARRAIAARRERLPPPPRHAHVPGEVMPMPNPADRQRSRKQPEEPTRTRKDPRQRDEQEPQRRAGAEEEVRGDRMPKGADEPGAGL
jgi:hypothetical protein